MNALEWLQLLCSYALQVSLVVGVAWALDHLSRTARAKARVWTACFLCMLTLLIAAVLLPRLQWLHPWSQLKPATLLNVAHAEYVLGRSLLAIYCYGVVGMLVHWVWHFRRLTRFINSCKLVSEAQQQVVNGLVAADLRKVAGRTVQFRLSSEELGPFCYQLHQPIVFVPPSLLAGETIELTHVLHHELAHLHTQHPLQFFFQRILQTLLWFHPLIWISGKRAGLVREFVCDEAVTEDNASTAAYLRTLLRIVEGRTDPQHGTFAIGRSAGELRRRAQRLTQVVNRRDTFSTMGGLLLVPLVALCASQLWLPTNPLVSNHSNWSRWPSWTAATLHTMNISVRDYELFDERTQIHELLEEETEHQAKKRVRSERNAVPSDAFY